MKKSFVIWGAVIAFLALEFLGSLLFNSVTVHSIQKSLLFSISLEVIFAVIFVILNYKIFKQKILYHDYSLGKGFGILWLAWFYILYSIVHIASVNQSVLFVIQAIILAAIIGFTEEYIFRGMILGSLLSSGKSLTFSVIVSSVLFGATHAINVTHNSLYNVRLQMLYAIPLGVLLAVLYIKSNNLIYAIILHASIDFNALIFSGGSLNSTKASVDSVIGLYVLVAIIAVPYLLAGKKQIKKFKRGFLKI